MDDLTITCDEITDVDTKAKSNDEGKSNDEETKTNFSNKFKWKKYNLWNRKFFYFTDVFMNYHCIKDIC